MSFDSAANPETKSFPGHKNYIVMKMESGMAKLLYAKVQQAFQDFLVNGEDRSHKYRLNPAWDVLHQYKEHRLFVV